MRGASCCPRAPSRLLLPSPSACPAHPHPAAIDSPRTGGVHLGFLILLYHPPLFTAAGTGRLLSTPPSSGSATAPACSSIRGGGGGTAGRSSVSGSRIRWDRCPLLSADAQHAQVPAAAGPCPLRRGGSPCERRPLREAFSLCRKAPVPTPAFTHQAQPLLRLLALDHCTFGLGLKRSNRLWEAFFGASMRVEGGNQGVWGEMPLQRLW